MSEVFTIILLVAAPVIIFYANIKIWWHFYKKNARKLLVGTLIIFVFLALLDLSINKFLLKDYKQFSQEYRTVLESQFKYQRIFFPNHPLFIRSLTIDYHKDGSDYGTARTYFGVPVQKVQITGPYDITTHSIGTLSGYSVASVIFYLLLLEIVLITLPVQLLLFLWTLLKIIFKPVKPAAV